MIIGLIFVHRPVSGGCFIIVITGKSLKCSVKKIYVFILNVIVYVVIFFFSHSFVAVDLQKRDLR